MRVRGAAIGFGLSLVLVTASCGSSTVSGAVPSGAGADAAADMADGGQPARVVVLPDAIVILCGNGALDPAEQCDDGNIVKGDGCSRLCQLEERAVCPVLGQPCHVVPPCGDGVVGAGEVCDDGNGTGGDGCTAGCASVESGWRCVAPGRRCIPICGDAEEADGGASDAVPGCGPSQCGDGIVSGGEECDDGAANADGVYGGCTTRCSYGDYCGDAVVNGPETCDLGTASNRGEYGDPTGCTARCLAAPYCGDNQIETKFESCDLGEYNGTGSSCTKRCQIVLP